MTSRALRPGPATAPPSSAPAATYPRGPTPRAPAAAAGGRLRRRARSTASRAGTNAGSVAFGVIPRGRTFARRHRGPSRRRRRPASARWRPSLRRAGVSGVGARRALGSAQLRRAGVCTSATFARRRRAPSSPASALDEVLGGPQVRLARVGAGLPRRRSRQGLAARSRAARPRTPRRRRPRGGRAAPGSQRGGRGVEVREQSRGLLRRAARGGRRRLGLLAGGRSRSPFAGAGPRACSEIPGG